MDSLQDVGVAPDPELLLRFRRIVRHIPERRLAPTGRPGGFVSRRRGRGVETVDIRSYTDGDDFRHVDRNVTARTGIAHVRTFRDERERSATLVADFRPSMLWGTRRAFRSVAAAEALAIVGWRVIEAGGRVGLVAVGAGEPLLVAAKGRSEGMAAVVGGIVSAHRASVEAAAAREGQTAALDAAIELARRVTPTGGSVFLASGLDDAGPEFEIVASALRRRCPLTVLLIVDAFERDPPPGTYAFVSRSGRVARSTIDRSKFGQISDGRRETLTKLGIPMIEIANDLDPEGMAEKLVIFDGRPL